jgi:hypothetical protein
MTVNQRNTSASGMSATEQRMRQIEKQFGDLAMNKCKDMSQKQITEQCQRLIDEHHALEQKLKALPYASGADSAEFNRAHGGMHLKASSGVKSRNVSPLVIPAKNWRTCSKRLSGRCRTARRSRRKRSVLVGLMYRL